MGVRFDFGDRETAHLGPDRLQGLVETRISDRSRAALAHQFHQPGTVRGRVARFDERLHGVAPEPGRVAGAQAERRQAGGFQLAHRDARKGLVEILAHADLDEERFRFAEASFLGHPLGISRELPDGGCVGGEPGERVGGMLLSVDLRR